MTHQPQDKPLLGILQGRLIPRKALLELADAQGVLAVAITPDSEIDPQTKTIKNVVAVQGGNTVPLPSVPFPHVVYDMQFSKGKGQKRRQHFRGIAKALNAAGSHFTYPISRHKLTKGNLVINEA